MWQRIWMASRCIPTKKIIYELTYLQVWNKSVYLHSNKNIRTSRLKFFKILSSNDNTSFYWEKTAEMSWKAWLGSMFEDISLATFTYFSVMMLFDSTTCDSYRRRNWDLQNRVIRHLWENDENCILRRSVVDLHLH